MLAKEINLYVERTSQFEERKSKRNAEGDFLDHNNILELATDEWFEDSKFNRSMLNLRERKKSKQGMILKKERK